MRVYAYSPNLPNYFVKNWTHGKLQLFNSVIVSYLNIFANPETAFKVENLCGLFFSHLFITQKLFNIFFSNFAKKKNHLWAETKHGKFHHKRLIFWKAARK